MFSADIPQGFTAKPKYLESKYFYDSIGDQLFQQLMQCDEYYLSRCEMEIFIEQKSELCKIMVENASPFDLVELGAGDASKSIHLLNYLAKQNIDFTYVPIDISSNIISYLSTTLPTSIKVFGLNGEYFDMLEKLKGKRRKVVLFLGSNLGNMEDDEAFCKQLRRNLSSGDLVIIGFDLAKNPKTILNSYDDRNGLNKKFVLNVLNRINRELNGNFNLEKFDYYATYDPETLVCKGYLISLVSQDVLIGDQQQVVTFEENECIYTGVSHKYTIKRIHDLASMTGFRLVQNFFDSKKWFVDSVWVVE